MEYQPYNEPTPTPPSDPYAYNPPPEKKRMNPWLIAVIVILLLLCCCCAFALLFYFVLGDIITDAMGITMLLVLPVV